MMQMKMTTVENSTRYMTSSETGLDGPDQILPTDDDITMVANGRIRIKYDENDPHLEVISIPGALMRTTKKHDDQIALVACPGINGKRKTWTYKDYESEVKIVAKAFLKLGLERYHSVAILGFNSPQWIFSELAAIYAGGFATGIYITNSAEACYYCAESSRANILVVENVKQLSKILKIKHRLPHLRAIIQYDGLANEENVYSWEDVLKIGKAESDERLDAILKTIGANECCMLLYTSGTVGNPKAVMLSHDNLIRDCQAANETCQFVERDEVFISYLPLSHIAAQLEIFRSMLLGGTIYFADKNALKGSLLETLVVARPTAFLGVPRIWEKLYEKTISVARANGSMKTWIATWAKAQGLQYNMNKMNRIDYKQNWRYLLAKWLMFNELKANLGLDKCRIFFTTAAPLSSDIKTYFMSLDIPIMEAYGMSETSGAHTMSTNNNFRLESVGPVMPFFSTRVDNPNADGEGEICMSGRHIFMGYLNEPEKTKEAMDENGWLHSGDLGRIDSNGFVYITGRIKEIVITSGGENVAPVPLEHMLLSELPALSNATLVGDMRKFLTVLVTLKTNVDPKTGEPLDTLTESTKIWAKSIGSKATTITEVLNNRDPAIYQEIEAALKRTNDQAMSNAQKLQKFRILPNDFSIPTGELGPTLKIRRNIIMKKYKDLIDEMYT